MALVVKDRVKETTTTTGTGTITLGGAVQGFQTFTSVLSNADTTYYAIVDFTNHEFEVGIGTFTSSGTTLARTTILESSNSGSAVNLGSGTKEVFITYPAEKSVYLDASNQLVINGSAVTSTVSELNILDGVTSTASELNILDGVTSTTAELNILDGVTSTTAELNILDGVTSTAAELNILDGKSFVDEDDMSSNSATAIASQQSIKAYVDSQVTAQDLDLTTDSGTIAIDLDSETLTIGGTSNEIETSATGNAVTIGLPSATQITTSLGVGGGSTNGVQISQGAISIKNGGTQSYVDFYCESSNAHYARLQAPAHSDFSGNITLTLPATAGTVALTSSNITGNAATATALATARTIHGVSFDGTSNIDLSEVIQDTVGAMFSSNTETNITATYQDSDGTIDLVIGTLNQDTTGNAATATALETARTIHGVSFDGTGNIDLTEVVQDTVGAMFSSNTESGITVTYQDSDGTIDLTVGTLNQDTTGNAATATALETARTIGGVSFDGTANINLPGVNTAGNQNTSGNAATATLSSTVIVTDSTANTNFPVVFHDESNALLDDTGALRYNPSTGELLVPKLTVAGTTTVVDTVTMNAANAIVFEGATADAHETTLSIVDPTSDHTQYLINQGGYIPVLAAATTTAITSTPEELNVLDGITSTTTELNIVDGNTSATSITVADADRVVLNDNGTMVQVAVTDLAAYFDDEITAMPNLVSTGTLNSGSITSGFGNINNGSSTITTTGLISGGSLDIDDVLINGSNIGHTDDTDLITLANGIVTVAGEVSVTTLDIGGTNVTSTAAELNILDGVTSTTSELNILDGVTSTTAELNILDGVTSTTSELNLLDGVTSTTSELNVIDGDTSASSTTLVDADRVVTNDNGTMKQVALTDIKTYLTSAGYASQADATALAIALG
jgi:hypothetical protein